MMYQEEVLRHYDKLTDFFKKLYFIYCKDDEPTPKCYKGIWWPSKYLTTEWDIEVEVTLSTASVDYKHEEDEYSHALAVAACKVISNPECQLSETFNDLYLDTLFAKKMFFEDWKKYTYPYDVYEKCKGGLKNFVSTSFSEDSWFSYNHFIMRVYAYRNKPHMYLSYQGQTLISKEEFKDMINRIDEQVDILERIYHDYYKEVIIPFYQKTDLLIDEYQELRRWRRDDLPFNQHHEEILDKLNSVYDDLYHQYQSIIDKENIKKYIDKKK